MQDMQSSFKPEGRQEFGRIQAKGGCIGETSRMIHERSMEHMSDARSFSSKSHIVKHWMSVHPELYIPPDMAFKITAMFKVCLSRQGAEALRINYSKDELLNSKGE